MKQLKKITILCLSAAIGAACAVSAGAADNPDSYLSDGITEYGMMDGVLRSVDHTVYVPFHECSFSYDFSGKEKQYSDFAIAPISKEAGIRLIYHASSGTHNLGVRLIRKDTGEIAYTNSITVLQQQDQELWIPPAKLIEGRGYYLELINPTIGNASGMFTINGSPTSTLSSIYDTSAENLFKIHHAFASQYPYREGDENNSFALYPGMTYASGIEYDENGNKYECPASYIDEDALFFGSFSIQKGDAKFIINGKENPYYDQCVLVNSRLLVPAEAFGAVGCEVSFNADAYVTTISKNGTVLEILPNLIGMRKNRADGYYVPLDSCARFIDNVLYVPVRAVAEEMGMEVSWDEGTRTVTLLSVPEAESHNVLG